MPKDLYLEPFLAGFKLFEQHEVKPKAVLEVEHKEIAANCLEPTKTRPGDVWPCDQGKLTGSHDL